MRVGFFMPLLKSPAFPYDRDRAPKRGFSAKVLWYAKKPPTMGWLLWVVVLTTYHSIFQIP